MIDFRYHLVSLAAVLIALSIGIVLGAGPLNDNIGSTLSGEVTKLRQEKEDLRRQANEDRQAIEGRDAYDEQTLPQVVGSRLSDDTATVVALPEASDDDVAAARSVLEQAGASVADTVEVTADWADADATATRERDAVGDDALGELGVTSTVPDGAQPIDQALAVVLTGAREPGDAARVDRTPRGSAWTRLRARMAGDRTPPTHSVLQTSLQVRDSVRDLAVAVDIEGYSVAEAATLLGVARVYDVGGYTSMLPLLKNPPTQAA